MSTWILLRGLMRESRHWDEFPRIFQQTVAAEHVITPDMPGNGQLNQLQSPASIEEMVAFLREDLQQRNIPPPYNILALSLGAMVAVAWSYKYPDEIKRMVLINTSLAPFNPFYHRLRPGNYPALISQLLFGSIRQREQLVLSLTSNIAKQSTAGNALLQNWIAYAEQYPVTRMNILRQLFTAIRFRAPDKLTNVSLLILGSEHDHLVNIQSSKTLAQKWHAAICIHPEAGHDLPLDDPQWVACKVCEWSNS